MPDEDEVSHCANCGELIIYRKHTGAMKAIMVDDGQWIHASTGDGHCELYATPEEKDTKP